MDENKKCVRAHFLVALSVVGSIMAYMHEYKYYT